MNELNYKIEEIKEIRDALRYLSECINKILKGIEADSITETAEAYRKFMAISEKQDGESWDFEIDVVEHIEARMNDEFWKREQR